MKKINQIALLSFSLLLSGTVCAADMDTPTPGLPSTQVNTTRSWTAEEEALGEDLVNAAHDGNRARTEEILTKNPLLANFKDKDGWIPLTVTAFRGYIATATQLIAAGANVNAQDEDGRTSLILAACEGWTAIVEMLIAADADVNMQDNDGWSALMLAAQEGHREIVNKLIDAGADVNMQDNDGQTALMGAARRGHIEIVQALLAACALATKTTNNGKTALEIAQEIGCYTAVVALLQNHVDIEPEEETLMVKPAVD